MSATLLWIQGFNAQLVGTSFDGAAGSGAATHLIDTSTVRRVGGASLKLHNSASICYYAMTVGAGSPSGPGTAVGVCYVNFASFPASAQPVAGIQAQSLDWTGVAYDPTSGQLCPCYHISTTTFTTAAAFGPVLQTGVWYRIEVSSNMSTATYAWDARVAVGDDTSSISTMTHQTQGTIGGDFVTSFTIGNVNPTGTTDTYDMYVTDIAASNTLADYPIGPITTRGYTVNAVGTHNLDASTSVFFQKKVSGTPTALTTSETTSWQTIDEIPASVDADGIYVTVTLGSPATPTFRSAGTWSFTSNNVSASSNLSPGAPAGKAVGDLLVLVTESRSNTASCSTPSGWTLLSDGTEFPARSGTSNGGTVYVFVRVADGTASDTPTVSWTGLTSGTSGSSTGAGILAFTNLTVTLDGSITMSDLSAQTSTSVIPATTTATNNSMVIGVAVKQNESSGQTSTVATFTERADSQTTSGTGHIVDVSTKVQTTAGSSGTATVTWSATTSARALTVSFALLAATPVTEPTATWYAEYTHSQESVISTDPYAVMTYAQIAGVSGDAIGVKIFDGTIEGAIYLGGAQNIMQETFWLKNPSNVPWTVSNLNALKVRIGYSNAADNNPGVEDVFLEAAFFPPPVSTDTPAEPRIYLQAVQAAAVR